MHPANDVLFPIPPFRHARLRQRGPRLQRRVAGAVLGGKFSIAPAQLFCYEGAERKDLGLDGGEEGGVGEGGEGVEVGFGGLAGKEEEVDAGFGVQVVDCDEGGGVRDDAGRGEGGG